MAEDLETLYWWVRVCLVIAAVCTTSFPLLFAFSPWYKSRLGRAIMIQAVAFSAIMDLTVLFMFWELSIAARLWVNAVGLSFIAVATAYLTWNLWLANYRVRQIKKEKERKNARRRSSARR